MRLRRELHKRGWSENHLGWCLGFDQAALQHLFHAEPVEPGGTPNSDRAALTPEMALRLEAALDVKAEDWMDLMRDRDLARLRDRMGGELARIRRRALLNVDALET